MPPLYAIKDWARRFENNRTRELKKIDWVPIPNKHDSDGYTLLMERKDGAAIYGAWIGIILVASKCDPRGTLKRDTGAPHDAASISRITRVAEPVVKAAITLLSSPDIGWIICIESDPIAGGCENPAGECGNPALGCLEGKGREGKGREENGSASESRSAADLETVLDDLQKQAAYKNLNVRGEWSKMDNWCRVNRKQPTHRRFINWLNRVDAPLFANGDRKEIHAKGF